MACCTLANLAEMAENMDRIADATAIPNLVSALWNPDEELKRESARCLGNLAANIEFGDLILREGALAYLIPMLRSSDNMTQVCGGVCGGGCWGEGGCWGVMFSPLFAALPSASNTPPPPHQPLTTPPSPPLTPDTHNNSAWRAWPSATSPPTSAIRATCSTVDYSTPSCRNPP